MTIISADVAYQYAYQNGIKFPADWRITEHFTWNEVFTNEQISDGYPMYEVFVNAMETAKQMQMIRRKLQKPIIVHCWVRQIPHNKRVGSTARKSAHINGRAVDFHVNGMSDAEVRRRILAMNLPVRVEDKTVGWVHVDIGNSYLPGAPKWGLFQG